MDWQLLEAAEDLGCRPWQAFYKITLPLSRNGILAGSMLVFIPAVGEFVIPALLGGPNALMIGRVLWDEFFSNRAWPVASAVAILLLMLLVPFMMWYQSVQARETAGAAMNYRSSLFILTLPRVRLRVPVRPDPVDGGVLLQCLEARDGMGRGQLAHAEVVLRAAGQRGDSRRRVDLPESRGDQRLRLGNPRHARGFRPRALQTIPRPLHAQRDDNRALGDARGDHRACRCCCCSSRSSRGSAGRPGAASPP